MRYISIFLLLAITNAFSQKKYWVYFNEHSTLTKLIAEVEALGAKHQRISTWLHAATFVLTEDQKYNVQKKDYVKDIRIVQELEAYNLKPSNTSVLNAQLKQINGAYLLERSLDGKGIKIGIIDAGFSHADSSKYFHHLFSKGLVKDYKDYINPDSADFFHPKTSSDSHGASVWKLIAGKDTSNSTQFGLAQNATFYLARTEIGLSLIHI